MYLGEIVKKEPGPNPNVARVAFSCIPMRFNLILCRAFLNVCCSGSFC